jgi:hypothetical protein
MLRAVLFAIMLSAGVAHAQEDCVDADLRASFMLERARSVDQAATIWSATWAVGYLGLTAAQLGVLASTQDPGTRADMAIGALGSMIGVASIFLLPVRVMGQRPRLEALAPLAMAGDCAALEEMERIFDHAADGEEFGSSWLMHVGSMLFNIGMGVVQGLAFGRWQSGMISAAIGIAVGEVQILTKPSGLIDARARYRIGIVDGGIGFAAAL